MKTYIHVTIENVVFDRTSFTTPDTGDGEKNWETINQIITDGYGPSYYIVGIKSFTT